MNLFFRCVFFIHTYTTNSSNRYVLQLTLSFFATWGPLAVLFMAVILGRPYQYSTRQYVSVTILCLSFVLLDTKDGLMALGGGGGSANQVPPLAIVVLLLIIIVATLLKASAWVFIETLMHARAVTVVELVYKLHLVRFIATGTACLLLLHNNNQESAGVSLLLSGHEGDGGVG